MSSRQTSLSFLDIARSLGCVAVVAIHAVGLSSVLLGQGSEVSWWTKTIVTAFSVWAVPVFVMISGALLLDPPREESARFFYTKRFWRVGLPALFWIPFYFVVDHFYRGDSLNVVSLFRRLVFSSYDHLYFLVLILQLYVLTPYLRKVVKHASTRSLFGLVLLFFVIAAFWEKTSFAGTMFVPFIGYYLLGAYLIRVSVPRRLMALWAGMFLGAGSMIVLLTYLVSRRDELAYLQDTFFYSHNKPLVMLLAVSAFLLLQSFTSSFQKLGNVWTQRVHQFSKVSFRIYILHPVILYLTASLLKNLGRVQEIPWWGLLLLIPYTVLLSGLITSRLQRNRYLIKLV